MVRNDFVCLFSNLSGKEKFNINIIFSQHSACKRGQVRSKERWREGRDLDKSFFWVNENEAKRCLCWVWHVYLLKNAWFIEVFPEFVLARLWHTCLKWNLAQTDLQTYGKKKNKCFRRQETLPLWTGTKAIGEKQYMFPTFLLNCWILAVAGGETLDLMYKWCSLVWEILLVNLL